MDDFVEYTVLMNKKLASLQSAEEEFVSDEIAAKAIAYINNMAIKDTGDLLLYCTALNTCNTYVKQPNRKIDYYFKKKIDTVVSIIDALNLSDVYVDYQRDKGMSLIVVQIGAVQFSFHGVTMTPSLSLFLAESDKRKPLIWEGIRKQHCAVSTFLMAENNPYKRSNITFRGKPLEQKIAREVEFMILGKREFKVN